MQLVHAALFRRPRPRSLSLSADSSATCLVSPTPGSFEASCGTVRPSSCSLLVGRCLRPFHASWREAASMSLVLLGVLIPEVPADDAAVLNLLPTLF